MVFTQAIIFEKKESGDADWRYLIFSREFGKMEFLSKGGKKIQARLTGHLEPWALTDIELVVQKSIKVIGASCIESYGALNHSPGAALQVTQSFTLLHRILPFYFKEEGLFYVMNRFLLKMNGLVQEGPFVSEKGHKEVRNFMREVAQELGVLPTHELSRMGIRGDVVESKEELLHSIQELRTTLVKSFS